MFKKYTTDNNEVNLLSFIIKNNISSLVRTAFLVEVINVDRDNNTVDVLPLINLESNIIYNIPYFIYQCGSNTVYLTPEKGDYGLCIVADRDISKLKNTKKRSNPNSYRMFDVRDSLYLGSFLKENNNNNNKEILKNSIILDKDIGITISSDNSSITIDNNNNITITANSNVNINSKEANIKSDTINIESSKNTIINSNSNVNVKATNVTIDSDNINLGTNPLKASVLTTNAIITSPNGPCTITSSGSSSVKVG